MSYIETRRAYLTDLLQKKFKSLDMNSMKNIITKKIRDEKEALKNLFEGNYYFFTSIHFYLIYSR